MDSNNKEYIYKKAYVIGIGTVATNCAKILSEKGITTYFIESRKDVPLSSNTFCRKHNINYLQLSGTELTSYLNSIFERSLIVSASNRYLFPKEVISKKNLDIINYHGALLPKYPGRNAESWAIFYGDKEGGITWHRVSPDIDAGDIIIQKSVPITNITTSLQLLRQYSRIAVEGFLDFVDSLLIGTLRSYSQEKSGKSKMYYSWMKPNDGILDLDWDYEYISKFLRAMDYGQLRVHGYPIVNYHNIIYKIAGYSLEEKIMDLNSILLENEKMTIYKNSGIIKLTLEK